MKKLVCLLLIAMICFVSSALAAEIDFAEMSDEELQELITRAQAELNSRSQEENTSPILYEENGIKLYLTGKYEIQHRKDADLVYFEYIVENNTTHDIQISGHDCYVNGWDIGYVPFYGEPKSGKKAKDVFCVDIRPASISEYKDIETVEFVIEFYLGKSKYSFSDPDYQKEITMTISNGIIRIQ